ncbi:hypothetical protein [Selenomonas sp. F0473]|uniref:hypothetical protein n=1 Tax=Selenomonas sp. F0473 TaxID=999423 RepID=UPI0025DE7A33|nr:hypothetical protein [Selenomonas sp. F0473]
MVEFLALFILLLFGLVVTVLIDAFYKYKEGRASIYFVEFMMGIVFLISLISISIFLNLLMGDTLDFIHTEIGQSIGIILMGGIVFIGSYPAHKYIKYLGSKNIDELPEKDRQIYPARMFIDRGAAVWMIGAIWMIVGIGLLIHELWLLLSK